MTLSSSEIEHFLDAHAQTVLVQVAEVKGSAPREAGAYMLVAANTEMGTIGGGQLEHMMTVHARQMIGKGARSDALAIPLGPGIGQCCGGKVKIAFSMLGGSEAAGLVERVRSAEANRRSVYVFGAGHVGQALVRALRPLPFGVTLVDMRADRLADAPAGVNRKLSAMPEAVVQSAPPGSAFLAITHDHALDFLIAREALLRADAAYVGMIGSKTKRSQFLRWLREFGDAETLAKRLVCPIGAGIVDDKRPEIIAALTAAEIIATMPASRAPAVSIPAVPAKNTKGE